MTAFASDSDSDDDTASKKKVSIVASSSQKRRAKIIQEDALKEDPTIFQYDEVYDEMAASREEAKKAKSNEVKEAKYINRLMVAAEKRKLENESRMERKVQKERDAEGDKYIDKEVFVTSAYRAKLEALKKAEEESQREEYLEQIGDVKKQGDLSGFYRHFYEQKLGKDKQNADEQSPKMSNEKTIEKVANKGRRYRRHSEHDSSDDNDDSAQRNKADAETSDRKTHIQSNIDADSDFSIDSSDSEETDEKIGGTAQAVPEENEANTSKKSDVQANKIPEKGEDNADDSSGGAKSEQSKATEVKTEAPVTNSAADDIEKMPAPPAPKKPKIDIWKKRTVGEVYLVAVQRYYERKQQIAVA